MQENNSITTVEEQLKFDQSIKSWVDYHLARYREDKAQELEIHLLHFYNAMRDYMVDPTEENTRKAHSAVYSIGPLLAAIIELNEPEMKWIEVNIKLNGLSKEQVLAADFKEGSPRYGEKLIGWLVESHENNTVRCDSDGDRTLPDVTHYIEIHKFKPIV